MTLEQLKAQQEALQAARFNGVLTVKAGDKTVTYKSNVEIQAALSDLEREIARLQGRPRARRIRTVCGKGL
jgi:superfamily I DNA and RNA helicase